MSDDKFISELPELLRTIAECKTPLEGALALSKKYGGLHPYIPRLDQELVRMDRDNRIRAEYDKGDTSAARLAAKYGLTERQIWNILGKQPETPPPFLPL